jgi:membrane dipeptidase
MCERFNIEVIAIGTDFDGTSSLADIKDIGSLGILFDALKRSGFTSGDIEKIMYKNTERVIRDVLR